MTPTPTSMITDARPPSSVRSAAPSIISNAPSTKFGSFTPEAPSDPTRRPTKLERLLRKLVPRKHITSVSTPTPKRAPRGRTGSVARLSV
ncbi:hypothetical protein OG21DRAFT_1516840 [Imleria badia]|nr:hypothetical protein OG21DRAFT_1516840 [Imleria badia]